MLCEKDVTRVVNHMSDAVPNAASTAKYILRVCPTGPPTKSSDERADRSAALSLLRLPVLGGE